MWTIAVIAVFVILFVVVKLVSQPFHEHRLAQIIIPESQLLYLFIAK